jgi:cardiolipin synthase (CMP-forming)
LAQPVNIPNIITVIRILLVPVTVWLMLSEQFLSAFLAFVLAGVSDGVDGYLARRFNWQTEVGAYLDALADKALLVSIYVVLGVMQVIPLPLVILVAARDIMIIGAVILSRLLQLPIKIRPLWISKVNTVCQIFFAALLLLFLGLGWKIDVLIIPGAMVVAVFTIGSLIFYIRDWLRHMSNADSAEEAP